MDGKRSYQDFRDAVKKRLEINLACWKLSEEDIEQFMRREEDEIKGGFDRYANGFLSNGRTDNACFDSGVNAVATCLEYCYE